MKANFLKNKSEQINKRADLKAEIEIPEGMHASIEHNNLVIKKGDIEIKRKLNALINSILEGNKIILEKKKATKKNKKIFGSFEAHFRNMIKGLNQNFVYRLQIASVHFPVTVSVDKAKNELIVKNFLGEKTDRRINLIEGVNVKVNRDIIEVESSDKEKAGKCAANIEKGTKVTNKDRRIYQDGIYIIEKPGREL